MVKLNKIYTKTGDDGTTGLGDGSRRPKHHVRVAAYGTVDETSSVLGLALASRPPGETPGVGDMLRSIQNDLFDVGADLCMPGEGGDKLRIQASYVDRLEAWIDEENAVLEPLTSFILPGGTTLAAWLHLGRTVCRRAERLVSELSELPGEEVNGEVLRYLNRLSDLLFVLARRANDDGQNDVLWIPGGGSWLSFELAYATPLAWADEVLREPLALLGDHAYCELGAASAAQSLIARRPRHTVLVDRLSALAAEEMRHFRRVHRLLVKLGGELGQPRGNPYAEGLQRLVIRGPESLRDRLLIGALIELRSHERFELLAARAAEPLRSLYVELGPSEAGHGALFLELARSVDPDADLRLAELGEAEGRLMAGLPFEARMHSGPPSRVPCG